MSTLRYTPSTYPQDYSKAITANHAARTAEKEGAFILPYLKPHHSILDVGCGPGTITIDFANYVPEGHATGVDLHQSVLDQAWEHVSKVSPTPENISFKVGNVLEGLPYPDSSFDVVFCNQMLLYLDDPAKGLREMKRVTKPGGFVACRETEFPFRWHPYLPGLRLSNKYTYDQVVGPTSVPDPQNPPHQPGHRSGALVHVWAREAGFEVEKMIRGVGSEVRASPEERKWWASIGKGRLQAEEEGSTRGKWKKLGATDEDIDTVIRDLENWAEDEDGWYAQLHTENIFGV